MTSRGWDGSPRDRQRHERCTADYGHSLQDDAGQGHGGHGDGGQGDSGQGVGGQGDGGLG